jgi:Spy/CpxP family protein refolding chaperone
MKIKTVSSTIVAVAALMLFSIPVTAFSEPKEMEHGPMPAMHHMEKMDHMGKMDHMANMCLEHSDKLGLTDVQVAAMKPVHREMQKKLVQFKADLKIAEINLQEVLEVKAFDMEKANESIKKIAELITANHLEMLKVMKDVRAALSDEQFKKMQKLEYTKIDDKKHPKRNMKKQS